MSFAEHNTSIRNISIEEITLTQVGGASSSSFGPLPIDPGLIDLILFQIQYGRDPIFGYQPNNHSGHFVD